MVSIRNNIRLMTRRPWLDEMKARCDHLEKKKNLPSTILMKIALHHCMLAKPSLCLKGRLFADHQLTLAVDRSEVSSGRASGDAMVGQS